MTKSSDDNSDLFNIKASVPYSKMGIHLQVSGDHRNWLVMLLTYLLCFKWDEHALNSSKIGDPWAVGHITLWEACIVNPEICPSLVRLTNVIAVYRSHDKCVCGFLTQKFGPLKCSAFKDRSNAVRWRTCDFLLVTLAYLVLFPTRAARVANFFVSHIYIYIYIYIYTVSQKKLSRFVFVRTSSNFHRFW